MFKEIKESMKVWLKNKRYDIIKGWLDVKNIWIGFLDKISIVIEIRFKYKMFIIVC